MNSAPAARNPSTACGASVCAATPRGGVAPPRCSLRSAWPRCLSGGCAARQPCAFPQTVWTCGENSCWSSTAPDNVRSQRERLLCIWLSESHVQTARLRRLNWARCPHIDANAVADHTFLRKLNERWSAPGASEVLRGCAADGQCAPQKPRTSPRQQGSCTCLA